VVLPALRGPVRITAAKFLAALFNSDSIDRGMYFMLRILNQNFKILNNDHNPIRHRQKSIAGNWNREVMLSCAPRSSFTARHIAPGAGRLPLS